MERYTLLRILTTLALAWVLASATSQASENLPLLDTYQAMRQDCASAGEESGLRCQRAAKSTDLPARNKCNDTLERARRMCMLDVMERQHQDIHGTGVQ